MIIIGAHADEACPGAVIHAAAGAGKSRLAREACSAPETMGELALWAQATASSATIPLGALASLVPDGVRSDDLLELMRRSTAALRERAGGREMFLSLSRVHPHPSRAWSGGDEGRDRSTLRGAWELSFPAGSSGGDGEGQSFVFTLASAPTSHVIPSAGSNPDPTDCPGTATNPQAASGQFCL